MKSFLIAALIFVSACHDSSPPRGQGAGTFGGSCSATSDCAAGLTCETDAAGFTGGACSADCGAASCLAGGNCADLRGSLANAQLCAPTCASDNDCRQGYLCCGAQGSVCLPDALCTSPLPPVSCTAPTLVARGTVLGHDTAPTGCQKPIGTSVLPAAQVQAKGTHATGDKITFDVPAGTGSVSIVQQAVNATASVVFNGQTFENSVLANLLTFPDGGVAYDDSATLPRDPSSSEVFFGGGTASTGAFTIPNAAPLLGQVSAHGTLPAGTWSFVVTDYAYECSQPGACTDGGTAGNTYDITVLLKPGIATPPGKLDLAFYVVGSSGGVSSAAAAVLSPAVQRMVTTMAGLYQPAGICLGTVEFWDVPSWAKSRYASSINADETDACSNLDQMITLSQPGNKVNLFLVNAISATPSGGGTVVGIDGTIPGPASVGGTVHSGAAVSMANLGSGTCTTSVDFHACGTDQVAYIASHETGHFLGLFHTSESDGEYFDPLTDTGKCSCESCAPESSRGNCDSEGRSPPPSNPAIVEASSCNSSACSGADNLMFWQLQGSIAKGKLSIQQAQVARQNPGVQ